MPHKTPSIGTHRRAPDRRPGARQRGYDGTWERIRAQHLRAYPDCNVCGNRGSHVDHIVPLARGGTHDSANLQTLCASCHSRKTVVLDGGFGKAR